MRNRVLVRLILCLVAACGGWLSPAFAATPTVAVLANRDDPESLELARYYLAQRGLDESAIVALTMPLTEEITWGEFAVTIWNPLVREAAARGWMLASVSETKDAVGRVRVVSSGHRLEALVICRGVPLRVAHDAVLYDAKSNPLTANPALQNTEASVDSELALLATGNPPIAAFVPNPLFNQNNPSTFLREQIVPVGRLDGPTLADAKGLVDRALVAERDGLSGRAYLDTGGPHRQGDEWLEACAPELAALGFETDIDREGATLPEFARFDATALYFGWYAGDANGPFNAPGFRFPVGAIALHIHSYSAVTMRSASRAWTGPLVAKGVTATFGNVAEPYLQFTHQPQLLLKALARGEPLGRAALFSINALSWKAVVIGDPLYRPFAVTSEAQWERRASLPPALEPYARLRRMRLLAAAGRSEEALALGQAGLRQNPSLPLALSLANLQLSAGDAAAARRSLGIFALLPKWRPADWPLVLAAASALQAAEDAPGGMKLMQRLLGAELPPAQRILVLKQGMEIARTVRDFTQISRWETEYAKLTAPPPAPAVQK
ncbi:MAG: TIGR03790 family protein [Verrucomicrobia bacterium]|nr:TIGR03790 family protein [Verrucomicrobiota bacterium]